MKDTLNPTQHEMKLNAVAFSMIKDGSKTLEMRINDEKRRKLKVGDEIVFSNRENESEKVTVLITKIETFTNLVEMFANINELAAGYTANTSLESKLKNMYKYYSPEEEKKYGVCAVYIQLV